MSQVVWDCITHSLRTIYTRAEVIAHGWSWHAGTAAIVVSLNCAGPAIGGPLPPLPAMPPGSAQGTPAPMAALPSPGYFLPPAEGPWGGLPIPAGGTSAPFEYAVAGPLNDVTEEHHGERHHEHHRHRSHWWDCVTPSTTPTDVPEPAGWIVLVTGLVGLGVLRCRSDG